MFSLTSEHNLVVHVYLSPCFSNETEWHKLWGSSLWGSQAKFTHYCYWCFKGHLQTHSLSQPFLSCVGSVARMLTHWASALDLFLCFASQCRQDISFTSSLCPSCLVSTLPDHDFWNSNLLIVGDYRARSLFITLHYIM